MKIYDSKYGQVHQGDCLKIMKEIESNSIETMITDPPAGISFMNKKFDHHRGGRGPWVEYFAERFREALRIIKPGGLALVWAFPKTSHWTACALEDAGWQIDTKFYHLFGSGWPKGNCISKGIDKHFGCEREKVENPLKDKQTASKGTTYQKPGVETAQPDPVHKLAKKWNGYRTQMKPMCEEWIVCRKPVDKNFVNNALKWGVGGYNISETRIKQDVLSLYEKGPSLETFYNVSFDTHFACLNFLSYISCLKLHDNNLYKVPLQNEADQDGTLPVVSEYEFLYNCLFPNDNWCGLILYEALNFQDDCQSCHRFCDERIRQIQEDALKNPTLFSDALLRICQETRGHKHNHCLLNNDLPSNSDVCLHIVALCNLLKSKILDTTPYYTTDKAKSQGRYPGTVIIDDSMAEELDSRSGVLTSGASMKGAYQKQGMWTQKKMIRENAFEANSGGASRYFTRINWEPQDFDFFYGGKATGSEKNEGLEYFPKYPCGGLSGRHDGSLGKITIGKCTHPTVKSLQLMRWLCTLSKPPGGGTVLDIFAGSFSTLIAAYQTDRKFIGIELDEQYCKEGLARLAAAMEQKKFDFEE